MSSIGTGKDEEAKWYNVNTGKVIEIDADNERGDCIFIERPNSILEFNTQDCFTKKSHFICQKLIGDTLGIYSLGVSYIF